MRTDVQDTSFGPCGAHGLRYPFRLRYDEGEFKGPQQVER